MAKKRRKRKQSPRDKILAEIKQSTQDESVSIPRMPELPKPKVPPRIKTPKVKTPKSRKKLTANQKEWNRIIRNARAVYRRLEKAGYQSDPSLKAMMWRERPLVVCKRDLEKLARDLHYKKIYDRFYGQVGEYGEARRYSEMSRAERKTYESRGYYNIGGPVVGGVNDAQTLWETFLAANAYWDNDTRKHAGWELIRSLMVQRWETLKLKYGEAQGNAYFAEVLNSIGQPEFTINSIIADRPESARQWVTSVFATLNVRSDLRALVEDELG